MRGLDRKSGAARSDIHVGASRRLRDGCTIEVMPEGDTIYRLARRLHSELAGRRIQRFHADAPRLAGVDLEGRTISEVVARGKHLLIRLADGSVLHSHMRMKGRWVVARGDRDPTHGRRVEVALFMNGVVAYCVDAPLVEWVVDETRALGLTSLGPDLLAEDFEARVDEALARLRGEPRVSLGEAIMDQRRVAGIGNEYKSELLFMARLDPFAPVAEAAEEDLRALLRTSRQWLRRNAASRRRRRTRGGDGPPTHVYRREGERCLVCDGRVERVPQGRDSRSTYFCATCQRVDRSRLKGAR